MSEQPQTLKQTEQSNMRVILFIVVLSLVCAFILSFLASALKEPQEIAKELDRSEQMLIAAHILNHQREFLVQNDAGEYVPARYTSNGTLIPAPDSPIATQSQIIDVYKKRLIPLLVNAEGETTTFEQAGIDLDNYVNEHRKTGYYKQPLKLLYEILPNPTGEQNTDSAPIGYVIPINGYGLWDAIYGYLAVRTDGNTLIGISWYDQKETPGLGANIAEAYWQDYFPGKKIFQPGSDGQTDFKTAPIGITVVKGKVAEVLGDSPKAQSAVDGMPGATLTGNGVTTAYRDVLNAYRPFLIKLHERSQEPAR